MINLSYYSIPAFWLLVQVSGTRGATLRLGWKGNVDPRRNIDAMEKSGKYSARVIAKLRRRDAAHQNGWEAMGVWVGSVIAANQVGLSPKYLNTVSVLYLSLRALYLWLFVNTTDNRLSFARSAVWWASNFCWLTTIIKAGIAADSK